MLTDLPPSEYQIGQRVRVVLSGDCRTARTGFIRRAVWHHKRGQYAYWIESDGREVSHRYFAADLEPVAE